MLERAAANARRAGLADRVAITTGDVHDLRSADGTFLLVLALGVIPWLASPPRATRELARVLAPGGYLIVDDFWNSPPCQKAVSDYRRDRGLTEEIVPVDWSAAFWRKQNPLR